ncbi:hypothetical protein BDW42DRAFT_196526 [Aspergillus taichungensis]|uniref:Uncharacterized protein n=1 Tax=Aspergillus taichungensis TaxID=482145 RepID=A0A2J5HJW4_9EURO|nr:hypothetical protein BDW42DRAFT_196526 [Aspergillus taichungensis]
MPAAPAPSTQLSDLPFDTNQTLFQPQKQSSHSLATQSEPHRRLTLPSDELPSERTPPRRGQSASPFNPSEG